jgi:transposase
MRALTIKRSDVTRERLLELAENTPGAWLGIRIAVIVLLLDGYRPTFLAQLFDLSRMSLTRWVHRLNRQGLQGLREKPRPGRRSQLTAQVRQQLSEHLRQSPEEYGLARAVWDGPTLARHLQRRFGVQLKARQAQHWLHRLGYRLKRASYGYLQARAEDVQKFRRRLKKTARPGEERGADL